MLGKTYSQEIIYKGVLTIEKVIVVLEILFMLVASIVIAAEPSIKYYRDSDLPEHRQARQAWKHHNVDSFRALSSTSVELLGENKISIGTIDFTEDEFYETAAFKNSTGLDITLEMNKALTYFSVKDHVEDVTYEANFDIKAGWIKDDELKEYEDIIILILSVHIRLFQDNHTQNVASNPMESTEGYELNRVGCYGRYVRGSTINRSRSYCCQYARDDANIKCSNRYCVGCCSFWSCDTYCGIGDYFCSCGITGRSCSSF